jgi:hypothetical protein
MLCMGADTAAMLDDVAGNPRRSPHQSDRAGYVDGIQNKHRGQDSKPAPRLGGAIVAGRNSL